MAQISTAISDLFLSLSSMYCAYQIKDFRHNLGCYGLAVFAISAALGVVRFGSANPRDDILFAHQVTAWLGKVVGMSFISSTLLTQNGHAYVGWFIAVESVFYLGFYKMLPQHFRKPGTTLISTVSVLSMICSSYLVTNSPGMLTGLGFILAGICIGIDGTLLGIPNVDLFHYVLALNNFLYIAALKRLNVWA